MIQRCNAFVLSQPGVKQWGLFFMGIDFVTILWQSEVIELSFADVYLSIERRNIPVVPHKAVAEVSRIGHYRRD